MTHARDRQVFGAGSVGEGWGDDDSQGHVPHLHGVVGHCHMPDFRRRNFHCNTTKTRRTRIKILMQIACMLLLGTDALSWYFHANADETAYYMVRISNFSVFCINYIFMSFFATYVWLTVSKNQHRKPAALHTVYALSVIGILLLIITQFTGLFYYFDDHNLYHRGNFYLLSQVIAVSGIALCLFMLISYRKNLDRITFLSMMSFRTTSIGDHLPSTGIRFFIAMFGDRDFHTDYVHHGHRGTEPAIPLATGRLGAVRNQTIQQRNVHRLQL